MEFSDLEASSRVELEDGRILTRCDQCRDMWRERNERGVEGEPPCDGCKTELLPENAEAARVFNKCRRQIITFFNGEVDKEIDLNYVALDVVMNWVGVKDKRDVSEKVLRVYHHFLNERNKGG